MWASATKETAQLVMRPAPSRNLSRSTWIVLVEFSLSTKTIQVDLERFLDGAGRITNCAVSFVADAHIFERFAVNDCGARRPRQIHAKSIEVNLTSRFFGFFG